MKNKHLSLENRIDIQTKLNQGESFRSIAIDLDKSPTTIANEVKKRSSLVKPKPYGRPSNSCVHRLSCEKYSLCSSCRYKKPKKFCSLCNYCNEFCDDYQEEVCSKLDSPPYVCNSCSEIGSCSLIMRMYNAKEANSEYENSWRLDREGFYLTGKQMDLISNLISPRIKQGHSPYAALCDVRDQIPCSISSVYRLIDAGELLVRNIDLPRRVRRKKSNHGSKKKRAHKVDRKCYEGRTYEDYLRFLDEANPPFVVEMDTVEGKKDGAVMLSLNWKLFNVIRLHLRKHNDAHSVCQVMNEYENALGSELFKELFPVILTDRGSEFSDPTAIEFSPVTGERRTYVFFCDPQRADQKGTIERNHVELRRLIPKGTDLNLWKQESVDRVCDNLNSYPRKKLKDKCPYESFSFFMGNSIPDILGWSNIPIEDVVLNANLFQR